MGVDAASPQGTPLGRGSRCCQKGHSQGIFQAGLRQRFPRRPDKNYDWSAKSTPEALCGWCHDGVRMKMTSMPGCRVTLRKTRNQACCRLIVANPMPTGPLDKQRLQHHQSHSATLPGALHPNRTALDCLFKGRLPWVPELVVSPFACISTLHRTNVQDRSRLSQTLSDTAGSASSPAGTNAVGTRPSFVFRPVSPTSPSHPSIGIFSSTPSASNDTETGSSVPVLL